MSGVSHCGVPGARYAGQPGHAECWLLLDSVGGSHLSAAGSVGSTSVPIAGSEQVLPASAARSAEKLADYYSAIEN